MRSLWNLIYILLAIFIVLALLDLLIPTIAFSATILSVLYTLLIIAVVLAVLHWIGLF